MRLGLSLGQRVAPDYEVVGVKKVESRSGWEEVELPVSCSFLLGRFRVLRGWPADFYGMAVSCAGHNAPCFKILPVPAAGGFSFPKGLELALVPESSKYIYLGQVNRQVNRSASPIDLLQPRATRKERTSTQEFPRSDWPVYVSLGAVFGLLIDMGRPRSLLGSITPGPVVLGWVPCLNVRLGANK